MTAPIDPKFALIQQLGQPQEEEVAPSVPTREEASIDEERPPLLANIPPLFPPRKKATPKVKPKPTQGELIADNVTSTYSSRFINYIKQAEGNPKQQAASGSFQGGRFRIYDDVGAPAIGYGHRLLPGEEKKFRNGITEEQATDILMKDIKKAEILAEKHFGRKGWAAMDPHRREMAIDFVYNLGPGNFAKFRSFSRSLRMGDIKGIRARYKRHYSPTPGAPKIPLKPRNDLFYKTFIMPLETGEIEIGQRREPIKTANR